MKPPRLMVRMTAAIVGFLALVLSNAFPSAGSAQEPLSLSESEKAWLRDHPRIGLAVDIDWAPFEFVDERKNYRGMAADYIRLVEKRLGVAFSIDKERPWKDMVRAVQDRKLDAFSLVVKTPQRAEYLNFTAPYISFPMVMLTLESVPYIDGLGALGERSVAVVESYATHDLLVRNHPDIALTLVKNVEEGLQQVSSGRVDVFIGNLAAAAENIRKTGITNLKVSGQTPYRFELSMAVRKDWPELVPILQKALDSITPRERDKIYNDWIRLKFEETVDYRLIAAVVGVGLFIVFLTLAWNRKLQFEIAQRQLVEAELSSERKRLNEIIWGTNVGTWEWNIQTGEVIYNERWAEILGYKLAELAPITDKTWESLAHPDDINVCRELLQDHFAGRLEHYENDTRMRHKNGGWAWVRDRGTVVEWGVDGKPLRMSGTHTDITERKKLDRMKSEFISTVSHELRTPVTSIKGALGLVVSGALGSVPKKVSEVLGVASKNTERLILLVNEILDMEKLDSGRMEFNFETVDLAELVKDSVAANNDFAREHGVTFSLNGVKPGVRVKGDAHRLDQVLANLLSNAAKFSHKGGEVKISVEARSGQGRVSVADNGIGIPKAFQKHLFERFAQADAEDSRQKGGAGLGLSISKVIVEKHGGVLDYETTEGEGTVFFFALPIEGNAPRFKEKAFK